MIEFEKSSDVSGYLIINDWKVYVEVSKQTDDKPYISSWKDSWPKDCVYHYKELEA